MAKTVINTDPVVGNELIDISWGNGVRGDLIRLADRKVELDGSLPMTGRLTLPSTAPDASHAIRRAWADAHYVLVDGTNNMTADLNMGNHAITNMVMPASPGAQAAVNVSWANSHFVQLDGGNNMSGVLTLSGTDGTGSNAAMRRQWIVDQLNALEASLKDWANARFELK